MATAECRLAVFDDIERCWRVHVLYGRLCGRVETIDARMLGQLVRAQLIGTYRILIDAERDEQGFRAARVEGVFEGSFIVACRCRTRRPTSHRRR